MRKLDSSLNLARTQATGANINALNFALNIGANALDVWLPRTLSLQMRMASLDNYIVNLDAQIRTLERKEALSNSQLSTNPTQAKYILSAAKQVREEDTPASPAREAAPGRKAVLRDGYQLVTEKDIKAPDRDDPSFKEALKILPDCDIYEKVTE